MFRNYFKILLRFMSRQKVFSLINISGLTIGIACSLLIMLYIPDELRFDRFHADAERIFRVGFEGHIQGKHAKSSQTGLSVAYALQKNETIESTLRMARWATFPVRYENKAFTEKYLLLVDPNFFRFFSFNLIEGHPDSVLLGERKVVISESAAKKYFDYKGRGDISPIGKTLVFAQGYTVRVSGIAEDPPVNAHFHFSLLLSLSSWKNTVPEEWITGQVITYYKIFPHADPLQTGIEIKHLLQQNLNEQLGKLRNTIRKNVSDIYL